MEKSDFEKRIKKEYNSKVKEAGLQLFFSILNSLMFILGIVLVAMKVNGSLNMSWIWILAPFWLFPMLALIFYFSAIVLLIFLEKRGK